MNLPKIIFIYFNCRIWPSRLFPTLSTTAHWKTVTTQKQPSASSPFCHSSIVSFCATYCDSFRWEIEIYKMSVYSYGAKRFLNQ